MIGKYIDIILPLALFGSGLVLTLAPAPWTSPGARLLFLMAILLFRAVHELLPPFLALMDRPVMNRASIGIQVTTWLTLGLESPDRMAAAITSLCIGPAETMQRHQGPDARRVLL
ncbi:hypothetical protein ACFLT5_02555 [Chloroflexota bacterium]